MRYSLVILIVVVGVGLGLRALAIDNHCLWFDETLSWRFLHLPFPEMIARIGEPYESNPPLYYCVLWIWSSALGTSVIALRSLAVLFGLITIWAVYGFMVELELLGTESDESHLRRARVVALVAAALVAVSPLQIHASQQVRMYSMGTALFALGTWQLLRALRPGPVHRWRWALFGVFGLAFCYTHYMGLLGTFGQLVFASVYLTVTDRPKTIDEPAPFVIKFRGLCRHIGQGPRFRPLAGVTAFIGLGCLPALSGAIHKGHTISWSFPLSVQSVPHETTSALLGTFATSLEMPPMLEWFVTVATLGVLVFVLLSCGWPGRFVTVVGLLPVAIILARSLVSDRSIYFCRYLTFFQMMWLASLALFLFRVKPGVRWSVVVAMALVLTVYCYPRAWNIIGPTGSDGMQEAVEYVVLHRASDEPLLAQRPITVMKASYYLRGRVPVKLCVGIPSRIFQTEAPFLDDNELIATEEVLALDVPGVWVLSTSGYNDRPDVTFPVPGHWRLETTRMFLQDYPGEGSIAVYHYRVQQ